MGTGQPRPAAPVIQHNQLIPLEISGEKPLQQLVDEAFSKRSRSDSENKRDLSSNNVLAGTFDHWNEQLRLANRPDVVVLHLKRFKISSSSGRIKKIETPVSLPENQMLDLGASFWRTRRA